ncbi:MAG TPA: hypothetical protein VKF79_03000 [Candidatus Acidoferrum sp.]|nr:hypothetical protein [Candidatus Acidoferrum sp.]
MLSTIQIGNSRIDVSLEEGELSIPHDDLLNWVRNAAESVAAYYQRFPVTHVALHIIVSDGQGVRGGRTFASEDGGIIRIHVGKSTTAAQLAKDWMLTHEMVHLTFPSVAENHHWIEEGIATYVEPFARVRAKKFDAHEMWFEVVRDLHNGLPQSGDQGLDHTHTWGRTYWGGALFCFLADIEIRKQTQNKKGLDDALRGILNDGGNMLHDWPLEKALAAGDQVTGTTVLQTLYNKMKDNPYPVDLAEIWQQLGIARDGDTVRFVDTAPLAAIREGITYGTPGSSPKAAFDAQTHTLLVGRRATSKQIP